jgi:hypothetical protein
MYILDAVLKHPTTALAPNLVTDNAKTKAAFYFGTKDTCVLRFVLIIDRLQSLDGRDHHNIWLSMVFDSTHSSHPPDWTEGRCMCH